MENNSSESNKSESNKSESNSAFLGKIEAFQRRADTVLGRVISFLPLLGAAAGLLFPSVFNSFQKVADFLFMLLTFTSALSINFSGFAQVVRKPKEIFATELFVRVVTPLVVLLIGKLIFPNDPDTLAGLLLIFCSPVAIITTIWSPIRHGDLPLTFAILLLDTVLAPFAIPLTLKLLIGADVSIDGLGMMLSLLKTVGIPFFIGAGLNQITKGRVEEHLAVDLKPVSKVSIFFIIAANCALLRPEFDNLGLSSIKPVTVTALLMVLTMAVGLLAGRIIRAETADRVSVMMGISMKNTTASLTIALSFLVPRAAIPSLVIVVIQQVFVSAFTSVVFRRNSENSSQ